LLSSFGLGAPKNISAPGATLSRYATVTGYAFSTAALSRKSSFATMVKFG